MTLENIYYVGQTIAVLAILVSLFGVYHQVRTQTQTARAELYLSATSAAALIFREQRSNPEFALLLRVGLHDWRALSKTQKVQLHSFYVEMVVQLDAVLTMREQNLISDNQSNPWVDNVLGTVTTPGGAEWWQETQHAFTPQVREKINQRLSDPETLPIPWTQVSAYAADDDDIRAVAGDVSPSDRDAPATPAETEDEN